MSLIEKGKEFISGLFGKKAESTENQRFTATLTPDAELTTLGTSVQTTQLKKEVSEEVNTEGVEQVDLNEGEFQQDNFGDKDELFEGLEQKSYNCLANTRAFFKNHGDIQIPPSQESQGTSAFSSWGLTNGLHRTLSPQEIEESQSYYYNNSSPNKLYYTNEHYSSDDIAENNSKALEDIKGIFAANPTYSYANVILTGVSREGKKYFGYGHSVALVKGEDGNIGVIDETIGSIDDGKKENVHDINFYVDRLSKRNLGLLGVAFYADRDKDDKPVT